MNSSTLTFLKRIALVSVMAGGACLQSGCMTPAQQLQESAVTAELHKGQSQAEVRQLFGQPRASEIGSSGRTLDFFAVFSHKKPMAGRIRVLQMRSLHVLYDAHGRVEKSAYYVGNIKGFVVPSDEEWQAGSQFTMDKVNQIRPNITTRDELIQSFGPATVEGLDVYGGQTMSWVLLQGRHDRFTAGRELVVRLNEKQVATEYLIRNAQPFLE